MCILAFVTQLSERFPLVLISNRDELLSRATHPVAVDARTGLLWAADGVAGGSWLGLHVASGRFAVVTNSARCPTAPLRPAAGVTPPEWRGAMPLTEVVRRMRVHTTPAADGGTNVRLEFVPDLSRGNIVRDFLTEGRLPGSGAASSSYGTAQLSASLAPPYYDGYNLLTAKSLFHPKQLQLMYTTNRYGAEHQYPTDHDVIHCLQNSYIDNWMEPKSALLRERFKAALTEFMLADGSPYEADSVATSFASSCLCAEPKFDLLQELQAGKAPAEKLCEYRQVLDAPMPYHGYDGESELAQLYGAGLRSPVHFPTDGYEEQVNFFQRNIFSTGQSYGTRTQTVVVVEKSSGEGGLTVHFSQRECVTSKINKQWKHFTIRAPP
ncbi:hypothetical protein DQ04_01321030 [Trypanosoma grayi]|uniref:hypothetical protein n=1 Tax=Trypanosoma grayi TaxID=71804 RepID=UPI0004F42AC1|nr:hypothetical protein DQ04_01321030 [Trypanosoma grayi]KEG12930.1 hypothetical protein DQ04_01321030 [Trypanosoma grayi]